MIYLVWLPREYSSPLAIHIVQKLLIYRNKIENISLQASNNAITIIMLRLKVKFISLDYKMSALIIWNE